MIRRLGLLRIATVDVPSEGDARDFDVVIVGAGIAGLSLAYFLAERGTTKVLVLEREEQPAFHATGRSAATLVELDPIPTLQELKVLGARFFRELPAGFSENPVLQQRGVMSIFREPQWSRVVEDAGRWRDRGLHMDLLSPAQASARVDGYLRESELDGAAFVAADGFLDVHELVSSYARHARRRGVEIRFATEVTNLVVDEGICRGIRTADGAIRARHVVNAAGAWVGRLAQGSGALPIRFRPLRRSLVLFPPPDGARIREWPLVWSDPHQIYFRDEAGSLMLSPMDEVPMAPCDATTDELTVAEGIERLRALAPKLVPRTLGRSWAGLRTFSPDRIPVIGEDPGLPGFFWLAGQGGCGIETSPALGQIAADLLLEGHTERFDLGRLAPERFAK